MLSKATQLIGTSQTSLAKFLKKWHKFSQNKARLKVLQEAWITKKEKARLWKNSWMKETTNLKKLRNSMKCNKLSLCTELHLNKQLCLKNNLFTRILFWKKSLLLSLTRCFKSKLLWAQLLKKYSKLLKSLKEKLQRNCTKKSWDSSKRSSTWASCKKSTNLKLKRE